MAFLDNLKTIVPQVLAGFGNKPETLQNVLATQDNARQLAAAENMKAFGDELFSSPAMDKETIFNLARKHRVDPLSAIKLVMAVKSMDPGENPTTYSKLLPDGRVQEISTIPGKLSEYGDPADFIPGKITGSRMPDPKIYTGDGAFGVYNPETKTIDPVQGLKPAERKGVSVTVGNTVYPNGNMPLTKSSQNKVQKDALDDIDLLGKMTEVRKLYTPEILTWFGKAKNLGRVLADKAGFNISEDMKGEIGKATAFSNAVDQFFNIYRTKITGAQASIKELDRLKQTMFNTDQSREQFKSSLNLYENEIKRSLRIRQKLLRNGIPVGSEEFGRQMDRAFIGGISARNDDDIDARWNELEARGYHEDQIKQQLIDEGYID